MKGVRGRWGGIGGLVERNEGRGSEEVKGTGSLGGGGGEKRGKGRGSWVEGTGTVLCGRSGVPAEKRGAW